VLYWADLDRPDWKKKLLFGSLHAKRIRKGNDQKKRKKREDELKASAASFGRVVVIVFLGKGK
jgi:hypothetical protein